MKSTTSLINMTKIQVMHINPKKKDSLKILRPESEKIVTISH